MTFKNILAHITNHWSSPVNRETLLSFPIQEIILQKGMIDSLPEHLWGLERGSYLGVVCDQNTYEIAGERLAKALKNHGFLLNIFVFTKGVHASLEEAEKLLIALSGVELIIAVGSGTINDLCKYTSFQLNIPYVVLGTAPSMNGYSSNSASLSKNGIKRSFKAQLPIAIYADLEVLQKAPLRMIRSGIGDLLCRPTAQFDWYLSSLLVQTTYDDTPFKWLAPLEEGFFEDAESCIHRQERALQHLFELLIISGLGMSWMEGSYPASQGEHMLVHALEVNYPEKTQHYFHGELVGVASVTLHQIQKNLWETEPIKPEVVPHNFINTLYDLNMLSTVVDKDIVEECKSGLAEKQNLLQEQWEAVCQKLFYEKKWREDKVFSSCLQEGSKIKNILQKIGAPLAPRDISLEESSYFGTLAWTHLTRNRFTSLDVRALTHAIIL